MKSDLRTQFLNFMTLQRFSAHTKRGYVDAVKGFEEWLTMAEDWHLWIKVAARGEVGLIGEPLCRMRLLPEAITSDKMLLFHDAVRAIRDLEEKLPEEFERQSCMLEEARRRCCPCWRGTIFSQDRSQRPKVSSQNLWPTFRSGWIRFRSMPLPASDGDPCWLCGRSRRRYGSDRARSMALSRQWLATVGGFP